MCDQVVSAFSQYTESKLSSNYHFYILIVIKVDALAKVMHVRPSYSSGFRGGTWGPAPRPEEET